MGFGETREDTDKDDAFDGDSDMMAAVTIA